MPAAFVSRLIVGPRQHEFVQFSFGSCTPCAPGAAAAASSQAALKTSLSKLNVQQPSASLLDYLNSFAKTRGSAVCVEKQHNQ
jgi:hypothetical protein